MPHFRLALGLAAGLAFGLAFGFVGGPVAGLVAGLLTLLLCAFLVGMVIAKAEDGGSGPRQMTFGFNVYRLGGQVFNGLLNGAAGLALGIGIGFVLGDAPLIGGIMFAILAMFNGWTNSFIRAGLGVPVSVAQAVTPASTLASDRRVSVFLLIVYGWVFMLARGFESGFASEFVFGLAFGIAVGLLMVASAAWPSFVVTRALLAARGQVPYGLIRFLDDAYHRGVLRQAGAVYQFRHVRLQQHLAAPHHHYRHGPPAKESLTVTG